MQPVRRFRAKLAVNASGKPKIERADAAAAAASESRKKDYAGTNSCMNARAAVEGKVEELKQVFGPSIAYTVIAASMRTIARFEVESQPLPANCSVHSLISFVFTFTGIPDEDVKRASYLTHIVENGKMSVKRMREEECLWAMALPFNKSGSKLME